ncbi:cupin domain-containing protein [Sphingomonas sp. LM7]|uniref:cupin domain-containing protein n=1 Tax=Sphingomonas sp. LM7 TaxID=1938607 RepID=UPI000983E637|nr:hypothetical protein [Sphingomonas sp. LM7]AQR72994.1 hypothetical protein BXU08_04285 [Sphingomonas sp. LM7]
MLLPLIFVTSLIGGAQDVAPVPGGCSAPAAENVGKPGCFLSAEIEIAKPPAELFWHITSFASEARAQQEAPRHLWKTLVHAHGRVWLYVVGRREEDIRSGELWGVVGPLKVPGKGPVTVRFMESLFPPGMRTRVHAHSGPEAFFVVDGEQCVETPRDKHRIPARQSYIVERGAHLQAAPGGRRSLVAIVAPKGEPWMTLGQDWVPTGFCS